MSTYNVSGDVAQPPAGVGSQSSLRVYSTYRYHYSGPARFRMADIRDSKDFPAAPYIGLRIALHQNGVQVGPTLTFFNENGANKAFGSGGVIPNGQYALQARTQRLSNAGGFQDPAICYWSGSLII